LQARYQWEKVLEKSFATAEIPCEIYVLLRKKKTRRTKPEKIRTGYFLHKCRFDVESYADVASLRRKRLKFMGVIGGMEIPGQVQAGLRSCTSPRKQERTSAQTPNDGRANLLVCPNLIASQRSNAGGIMSGISTQEHRCASSCGSLGGAAAPTLPDVEPRSGLKQRRRGFLARAAVPVPPDVCYTS
jgi:hypothetical protein